MCYSVLTGGRQTGAAAGFSLLRSGIFAAAVVCLCVQFPCAVATTDAGVEAGGVDTVWVRKSERRLYLLRDYRIIRNYPIALGRRPVGHKLSISDARTPEGVYLIDWRNPRSSFHLSLHISYPNVNDLIRAEEFGFGDAGQNIMIHGQPSGGREREQAVEGDWTDGCIALSNLDMEEVWRLVADGTPILIDP